MIRPATPEDAAAIAAIYAHYVLHTIITFEEEPPSADEMAGRIREVTARFPWLVLEREGAVLGFAYARAWRERAAYRHSVESTIYLDQAATGEGLGTRLYTALLDALAGCDVHVVVGGIALPNPASVALHERLGFRKTAQLVEIGRKFGRWIDVGYWQRPLAPRSLAA